MRNKLLLLICIPLCLAFQQKECCLETHLKYYEKYIDKKDFFKLKEFHLSDEEGKLQEQSFTLSKTREYEIYFTNENWDEETMKVMILNKERDLVEFTHTLENEYLHKVKLKPSGDGIHYLTFSIPEDVHLCGYGVIGFRLLR